MNLDNFGKAVRECREARGWTQEELAGRLAATVHSGWNVDAVIELEKIDLRETTLSYTTIETLAAALNIPIAVFLMLATPIDDTAGVSPALAARFRNVALALMRPEEDL